MFVELERVQICSGSGLSPPTTAYNIDLSYRHSAVFIAASSCVSIEMMSGFHMKLFQTVPAR